MRTTKYAFLGSALAATGRGALNVGKGLFGMGAMKGSGLVGKGLNGAAQIGAIAAPMMGSIMPGQKSNPALGTPVGDFKLGQQYSIKVGFHITPKDLIDIASYGSFIGSKFVPHDSPWHTALDAAGLIGLGGTTAHSLITDKSDRGPSAKDLLGLGLMGSALYDRMGQH